MLLFICVFIYGYFYDKEQLRIGLIGILILLLSVLIGFSGRAVFENNEQNTETLDGF